jgi:hypothetical protein
MTAVIDFLQSRRLVDLSHVDATSGSMGERAVYRRTDRAMPVAEAVIQFI